ncbi:MAG: hypothetical protein C7B46_09195 [Sulfobacillus benefaciens]|uniref:Cas12f1-like TNB domain-containing protein n=1 Tax=Sulfobacillus benefaciens TaxID=453960 RepID=A0A2T2XGD6_9FIRM|nr:MAG: hypothetical protein C7B46_09195 [Sulfobacillus benefaciens]
MQLAEAIRASRIGAWANFAASWHTKRPRATDGHRVNRWYPSSKACAACGDKMLNMPLSVRECTGPACHTCHDRDVNAATNLRKVAESSRDGCPFVSA